MKMNQVLNKNERLLEQVINKDIMNIMVNSSVVNASVNMHECKKCLKLETKLLNKKDFIEKETYDKLFKSYTTLEKHCISLEVDTQLNQEIFQRDNSVSNLSAPSFDQYFELNELKAQSQAKDTVISKLKKRIKSLSENVNENKVKKDIEEIETINIELDHREQGLIIAALRDELRKLKGKAIVDNAVTTHTIDLEMLKVDVEPIASRLSNNRSVHSDYLRLTQEQDVILREVVEQGKSKNPLNNSLDHACKYTKRIQELLILIRQTCPRINNLSDKLVAVTPKYKDKRVRFTMLERAEVYYERMEPFKSLMCLWVRNKSIAAIWLEKVVTPLIEPTIKGFAAAPAVLKPKRLKVDKTRFKYFGRLCPNEIYRLISLALDSISALLLFGDRRLERTATFSISTISE
nr:hypothetical protein [Tanacetum cinerariifolium]